MIKINNKTYRLVEEYKNAFDLEVVKEKLTDYFDDFDYIVGDWAYGKLRLKGFCKKENKRYRPINYFTKKQDYLKNYCAPEAPYFVLEYMKK